MWSRLRTIELGAGHLEENQEYFPPLRIILCHGRHHEPKLLGKLQSPSPLHLVLDLKAQTSMAYFDAIPSPANYSTQSIPVHLLFDLFTFPIL